MPVMSNGIAELPTPQEELQARLADPRVVNALNRLLDKLDVVAASVEMADGFIRRSSDIADNVSDSVAEIRQTGGGEAAHFIGKLPAIARASVKVADAADSPSFDRLLESGLLNRLAAPETIAGMTVLLDKLDLMVFAVQAVDGFLRRGDDVANSIAESVAELRKVKSPEIANVIGHIPQLATAGVQLAEATQAPEFNNLLGLVKDLGNPATVASIRQLLDKLDLAVFAINAIDGFLRRGDEVANSMAEGFNDIRKLANSENTAAITQYVEELPKFTAAGRKLISSGLLERMSELTEAGMMLSNAGFFEPKMVQPLAELGRMATESYVAAKATPVKQYGFFDLLRLLKDPEAQRTIHLLVEMSKQFGSKLA
jgi:uncharacterized protein YjgD (DUF1641 family)